MCREKGAPHVCRMLVPLPNSTCNQSVQAIDHAISGMGVMLWLAGQGHSMFVVILRLINKASVMGMVEGLQDR